MKQLKTNMVVYLLMRSDLPSLNPGKAMAQAHHAGTQLLKHAKHPDVKAYLEEGEADGTDTFGTTITLGATLKEIASIWLQVDNKYLSGRVLDPSYPFWADTELVPWLNKRATGMQPKGDITVVRTEGSRTLMTRPEVTCMWILGSKDDENFTSLVKDLTLHT